jgi:arylsulfatase A-like enzyme
MLSCGVSSAVIAQAAEQDSARPNIVYLMADELGYFEPGFMGGKTIQTPNIDKLAAGGVIFHNMFAGGSVCAPTRCTLMTGKHGGHTSVRLNGGGTPLRAEEETIASILKKRGYATGGFGKWGLGGRDSTGVPEKHGFDDFFGYYDQVHAHTYYPPYLIRNSEEVPQEGNNGGRTGQTYSHYVIHAEAMKFIREHAEQPFFAYLPYTPPHGNFDIPDFDPAWAIYKDQPWPEPARRYAAMVSLVDREVGEIVALLRELGIEQNTLIFFCGDNGGADYFKSEEFPRGVHSANKNPQTGAEYRGAKGSGYEGGVRIPFCACWPGRIPPGRWSAFLGYFPDVLPTIAELTGAAAPADIDGISFVPELLGEAAAGRKQAQHEYLYWETAASAAIRQGQWRAVRPNRNKPWELFDLSSDPGETNDLAAEKSDVLSRLTALAEQSHEPVREGTFSSTERHERDRRAKFGKQDEPPTSGTGITPGPGRQQQAAAESHATRSVCGWTLHISRALLATEPELTERAVALLDRQLEEITRVVVPPVVVELQQVPLYFNPEYAGKKPTAEFHPDGGWLRANGRDPAMEKGVEFTNLRIFEQELDRMPNFALHELAHAYHNRVLPGGFENPQIKAVFENAQADNRYDKVERRFGNGKRSTIERAYAMTNPMEYFAECSEAYFATNDFFPFSRRDLQRFDPQMFELLGTLWHGTDQTRDQQ